jgi:hypothetical protein
MWPMGLAQSMYIATKLHQSIFLIFQLSVTLVNLLCSSSKVNMSQNFVKLTEQLALLEPHSSATNYTCRIQNTGLSYMHLPMTVSMDWLDPVTK